MGEKIVLAYHDHCTMHVFPPQHAGLHYLNGARFRFSSHLFSACATLDCQNLRLSKVNALKNVWYLKFWGLTM